MNAASIGGRRCVSVFFSQAEQVRELSRSGESVDEGPTYSFVQ